MHRFTRQTLILSFLAVGLISAILGGFIALALFSPDPEVVVREVEVEVEPIEPWLEPTPEDFSLLVQRYIGLTGGQEEWTTSLVDEIVVSVCNAKDSVVDIEDLRPDIELNQTELDTFIDETRSVCPDAA